MIDLNTVAFTGYWMHPVTYEPALYRIQAVRVSDYSLDKQIYQIRIRHSSRGVGAALFDNLKQQTITTVLSLYYCALVVTVTPDIATPLIS